MTINVLPVKQVFLSESSGFISCGISCRVHSGFRNQCLIPLNLCLLPLLRKSFLKGCMAFIVNWLKSLVRNNSFLQQKEIQGQGLWVLGRIRMFFWEIIKNVITFSSQYSHLCDLTLGIKNPPFRTVWLQFWNLWSHHLWRYLLLSSFVPFI